MLSEAGLLKKHRDGLRVEYHRARDSYLAVVTLPCGTRGMYTSGSKLRARHNAEVLALLKAQKPLQPSLSAHEQADTGSADE